MDKPEWNNLWENYLRYVICRHGCSGCPIHDYSKKLNISCYAYCKEYPRTSMDIVSVRSQCTAQGG